jgi:hypothetical protein
METFSGKEGKAQILPKEKLRIFEREKRPAERAGRRKN